jgi:hypothetical protein
LLARELTIRERKSLQEALSSNYVEGNIRLREGEYQYVLAEAIGAFQLELMFPNVKEIIKRLYGEGKTNDINFVRKIQTILKKMEKSDIIRILPKKKPWELQRYSLSSFKFRDSEGNLVSYATEEQVKRSSELLQSVLNKQKPSASERQRVDTVKKASLLLVIIVLYITIVWTLVQPIVNPIILIPALSVAVVCCLMLGRMFSR